MANTDILPFRAIASIVIYKMRIDPPAVRQVAIVGQGGSILILQIPLFDKRVVG